MLQDQTRDTMIRANAEGHFISCDGDVAPMLTSDKAEDDLPENTDADTSNLLQAINLYLSQYLQRD